MSAEPAAEAGPTHRAGLLVPAIYVAAVFTSALLLFSVQPMFTRMVLPRLGGSPSVWSIAMVFFQSMLLAGYAYAHLLTKLPRPLHAAGLHLVLLLAAAATLPLSIASGWGTPPSTGEGLWLLGLFTVSIGLPFFALSANNPLLQAWYVRTGAPGAANPYFLYAASNVGSFLALLAYPFVLEPVFTLREHLRLWTGGFYLLIALIAACGVFIARAGRDVAAADAAPASPRLAEVASWIGLSAVPSGLLVAVTAHISTDVAAAPLLWVIPLSLYLITWVIVFASRPIVPHAFVIGKAPYAAVALVAILAMPLDEKLVLTVAVHLVCFFVLAMACHGELSRRRPHPAYLTAFYLSLSAGGVIGGIFAGLVAPNVFSWIAEYPILIVLAVLCLPAALGGGRYGWIAWPIAALAAALLVPGLFGWAPSEDMAPRIAWTIVALAVVALAFGRMPVRFALLIGLALALIRVYPPEAGRSETMRSFFGVLKIRDSSDGRYRMLLHGTTLHGVQMIRDEDGKPIQGRPVPLSFYHDDSPLTQGLRALRAKRGPLKVAAIGLGTGSLVCQNAPGETWKYFEIDQNVVQVARERFTFLSSCMPDVPIVLGDARLSLANEADGFYDAIVVDAFSSDAIPIHLLTREAMALYLSKLKPGGAVLLHVSNRNLELASVAAGIAAANGLVTLLHDDDSDDRDDEYIFASDVAIAVKEAGDAGDLVTRPDWHPEEPDPDQKVWTDDYSNILGSLLRKDN